MSKPRVRLDVVVELKERRAEKAIEVLASARRAAESARSEANFAKERLFTDDRRAGSAHMWAVADVAQLRVRGEVKVAERRALEAESAANRARTAAADADRQREAMTRAAQAQRDRLQAESRLRERRSFDEVATLLHNARRSP